MKKLLLILISCLLISCSNGVNYELWQIPTDYVDKAIIESYYEYDESATLTKEDANTLLQAYNSLKNVEEINPKLIGAAFMSIDFYIGKKSYHVSVDDIYTYIYINEKFYKCPNNQDFDDVFRELTEKYNIKKTEYWKVFPPFGKFDELNYMVVASTPINDILSEMGIEKLEENITINEFLKDKMDVKMNEEYKYENLTFKIIDKNENDILLLFMQVN